jgi:hypothetical protein
MDEHGISRKRQKQRHGKKKRQKQKHLPRINTEFHEKKHKLKIGHGNKTKNKQKH